GPAARLLVGEVLPAGAVRGVVLADRAPLALGEVGPPALPVPLATGVLVEPAILGGHAGRSPHDAWDAPPAARRSTPARCWCACLMEACTAARSCGSGSRRRRRAARRR